MTNKKKISLYIHFFSVFIQKKKSIKQLLQQFHFYYSCILTLCNFKLTNQLKLKSFKLMYIFLETLNIYL